MNDADSGANASSSVHRPATAEMNVDGPDEVNVGPVAPGWALALGALGVSASSVFIELSGTTPGTATFFRCALAVPLLALLGRSERRREGSLPRRAYAVAALAGALFAGDALLWTQAIYEVGAGLSTVLVNAQVFIVPVLALLIDREILRSGFIAMLPVMVVGVLLTGGVFESGLSGSNPTAGTVHAILAALCYSGFLFLLRRGGLGGHVIESYTAVVITAALVSLVVGSLWQGVTLAPGWAAAGWLALTAACGQVIGWLLVALATPRLRVDVGAALLMLTPVGSLILAALALHEQPTWLQFIGCVLILASAYLASTPWLSRIITPRSTRNPSLAPPAQHHRGG